MPKAWFDPARTTISETENASHNVLDTLWFQLFPVDSTEYVSGEYFLEMLAFVFGLLVLCLQPGTKRTSPVALLLLLALLASSLFLNDLSKVVFGEFSDVEEVVVSWLLTAFWLWYCLAFVLVFTESLWSNSTVHMSKDTSPLYAASFCVIYLFALGWFVLTRWEENCGNQLLGMIGGFSIPAWFAAASGYQNSTTFELATNFAICGLLVFLSSLLSSFLVRRIFSSHSPNGQVKDPTGRKPGCALSAGAAPLPISRLVEQQGWLGLLVRRLWVVRKLRKQKSRS